MADQEPRVRAVRSIHEAVRGAHIGGVAADLGTAAGCDGLINEVLTVDILVNNVGIFEPKPSRRSPTTIGCDSSRST
ncbi:MAG TPA: hypothetical protein VHR41_12215 [Gemmatimonadales bacterium]|jgi:NAD(P)-dependent dehydrogenase (short-subunit alcohol dehydrogenase family)|nr:hypothetical protein [Gemmatimonadales bacterium]